MIKLCHSFKWLFTVNGLVVVTCDKNSIFTRIAFLFIYVSLKNDFPL